MLYESVLRPLLFAWSREDAERAHDAALHALARLGRHESILRAVHAYCAVYDPRLSQTQASIRFANPIGLAAGFDKNAVAVRGLSALGFGFLELGTVTLQPQEGNPRPRMFRLPRDHAIINRMGFNNRGSIALMDALVLSKAQLSCIPRIPLGVSIGKSKVTPLEDAADDYCGSLRVVHRVADFIVLNVSSPNTPGLRALQDREHLTTLLGRIRRHRQELANAYGWKPMFVKVSPDLSDSALEELLEVCQDHGIDGYILTNTTLSRSGLKTVSSESGGLSGRPLFGDALSSVRFVRRKLPGTIIIGVGGVFTAHDAFAMLVAGANLVQVYTGFVYGGPTLVRSINRGVLRLMEHEGMKSIHDFSRHWHR